MIIKKLKKNRACNELNSLPASSVHWHIDIICTLIILMYVTRA